MLFATYFQKAMEINFNKQEVSLIQQNQRDSPQSVLLWLENELGHIEKAIITTTEQQQKIEDELSSLQLCENKDGCLHFKGTLIINGFGIFSQTEISDWSIDELIKQKKQAEDRLDDLKFNADLTIHSVLMKEKIIPRKIREIALEITKIEQQLEKKKIQLEQERTKIENDPKLKQINQLEILQTQMMQQLQQLEKQKKAILTECFDARTSLFSLFDAFILLDLIRQNLKQTLDNQDNQEDQKSTEILIQQMIMNQIVLRKIIALIPKNVDLSGFSEQELQEMLKIFFNEVQQIIQLIECPSLQYNKILVQLRDSLKEIQTGKKIQEDANNEIQEDTNNFTQRLQDQIVLLIIQKASEELNMLYQQNQKPYKLIYEEPPILFKEIVKIQNDFIAFQEATKQLLSQKDHQRKELIEQSYTIQLKYNDEKDENVWSSPKYLNEMQIKQMTAAIHWIRNALSDKHNSPRGVLLSLEDALQNIQKETIKTTKQQQKIKNELNALQPCENKEFENEDGCLHFREPSIIEILRERNPAPINNDSSIDQLIQRQQQLEQQLHRLEDWDIAMVERSRKNKIKQTKSQIEEIKQQLKQKQAELNNDPKTKRGNELRAQLNEVEKQVKQFEEEKKLLLERFELQIVDFSELDLLELLVIVFINLPKNEQNQEREATERLIQIICIIFKKFEYNNSDLQNYSMITLQNILERLSLVMQQITKTFSTTFFNFCDEIILKRVSDKLGTNVQNQILSQISTFVLEEVTRLFIQHKKPYGLTLEEYSALSVQEVERKRILHDFNEFQKIAEELLSQQYYQKEKLVQQFHSITTKFLYEKDANLLSSPKYLIKKQIEQTRKAIDSIKLALNAKKTQYLIEYYSQFSKQELNNFLQQQNQKKMDLTQPLDVLQDAVAKAKEKWVQIIVQQEKESNISDKIEQIPDMPSIEQYINGIQTVAQQKNESNISYKIEPIPDMPSIEQYINIDITSPQEQIQQLEQDEQSPRAEKTIIKETTNQKEEKLKEMQQQMLIAQENINILNNIINNM